MSGLFGFFKSENDNVKRSSEEQLADIAHELANKSYSDPNYLFIWPIIFLTNRQL
jgi:hypothetical protein